MVAQLIDDVLGGPASSADVQGDPSAQVLVRKGGIREPTFRPLANNFLLFPTAFHTDGSLLKEAAHSKYAAVSIPFS